ncbi:MAG: hypothetical protein EOO69_13240 [Moraxellaceae bacterium]|nr:MAG: hypothetical protein EOO69_13240 [Moraxellaceae bacterium]
MTSPNFKPATILTDTTNSNIKVGYHPDLKQWYMTDDGLNWIALTRSIKYGQTALSYARNYFKQS